MLGCSGAFLSGDSWVEVLGVRANEAVYVVICCVAMVCRTLALVIALAMTPLFAQSSCAGQIKPIRPVGLSCSNPSLICITSPDLLSSHWLWGCASERDRQPQVDSSIPLSVHSPRPMTATEAATEAEKLRSLLQLQNQLLEQQIKLQELHKTPPQVERNIGSPSTFGSLNGYLWKSLAVFEKKLYISGIHDVLVRETEPSAWEKYVPAGDADVIAGLDGFYSYKENLPIPIVEALHIVILRLNRRDQSEIEAEILKQQRMASESPEFKKQD